MKAPVNMNCSEDGCPMAAAMFGVKGVLVLAASSAVTCTCSWRLPGRSRGADPAGWLRSRTGDVSTCCATPRSGTGPWW